MVAHRCRIITSISLGTLLWHPALGWRFEVMTSGDSVQLGEWVTLSTSKVSHICSYFLSYVVLSVKLNQKNINWVSFEGILKASKSTIQVHLTSIEGAPDAHLPKQWWETGHCEHPMSTKDVLIREPSLGWQKGHVRRSWWTGLVKSEEHSWEVIRDHENKKWQGLTLGWESWMESWNPHTRHLRRSFRKTSLSGRERKSTGVKKNISKLPALIWKKYVVLAKQGKRTLSVQKERTRQKTKLCACVNA